MKGLERVPKPVSFCSRFLPSSLTRSFHLLLSFLSLLWAHISSLFSSSSHFPFLAFLILVKNLFGFHLKQSRELFFSFSRKPRAPETFFPSFLPYRTPKETRKTPLFSLFFFCFPEKFTPRKSDKNPLTYSPPSVSLFSVFQPSSFFRSPENFPPLSRVFPFFHLETPAPFTPCRNRIFPSCHGSSSCFRESRVPGAFYSSAADSVPLFHAFLRAPELILPPAWSFLFLLCALCKRKVEFGLLWTDWV